MSARSSRGSVASSSASSAAGCESRGRSSKTPTAGPSSRATSPGRSASKTSARSARKTSRRSTSSAAASPVKTSAPPATAPESMLPARVFGPSSPGSFASFDPATSSWRTCPRSSLGKGSDGTERRSEEFSETWPKQGMTRSGRACPLESSGHPTCASESGSWPTPHGMPKRGQRRRPGPSGNELGRAVLRAERERFPTPTATDARKGYSSAPGPENARGRQTLSGAVQSRLWPTPKATPSGPDFARAARAKSGGDDLVTAVAREELWPTPNAADGKGGRISPDAVILSGRRPSGAKAQRTLREAIRKKDLASDSPPPRAGALNPTWVEWLMGFPIGWTALRPSETPSSHRSRSGSAGGSSTTRRKPPAAKRRPAKAPRRKDRADG